LQELLTNYLISYEPRHPDPLLDVRMFAIPQFLNSNIVGWVSTVALFGAEFMLPLYLQVVVAQATELFTHVAESF
jgi:hypothetical protein